MKLVSSIFITTTLLCIASASIVTADDDVVSLVESPAVLIESVVEVATDQIATAADLQPSISAPVVQETFNTQEGSEPSLVLNDSEVEIIEPTPQPEETAPSEEESSQEEQTPLEVEEQIAEDVSNAETEEIPQQEETQNQIEQPAQQIEISRPKSVYTFSLGSRTIPTRKKVAQQTVKNLNESRLLSKGIDNVQVDNPIETIETSVTNSVTPILNNETGEIILSGQCSSLYFVVLVYGSESDYADNPGSYILNKAFECENNSFSYAIKDLPNTLKDGIYYILIGEQAETGTWMPASALTEINLNRR